MDRHNCENCGATVGPPVNGVVTCAYCGTVYEVEQPRMPVEGPVAQPIQPAVNYTPDVQQPPYQEKRKASFAMLVFLGLIWWGVYAGLHAVLYANFGHDFAPYSTVYNNIFISPIGGIFWVLRGIIFLIVIPGLRIWSRSRNG